MEPNRFPSLLGTNIQLRRRSRNGAVETVLVIAGGEGASLLRGQNGLYTLDGPSKDLDNGFDIDAHYYWVQMEAKQARPRPPAGRVSPRMRPSTSSTRR